MRAIPSLAIVAALLLAGACAPQMQTLRPAAGPAPSIVAAISRPVGPGPFQAVVLLHGCAGPRNNAPLWAEFLTANGFLVAIADQFSPRGIGEICTSGGGSTQVILNRMFDTVSLVRLVQQRPDVQADRVFALGFSHGGMVAASMAGDFMAFLPAEHPANHGGGPQLAASAAIYPWCVPMPTLVRRPLLVGVAGADDWTTPASCDAWRARVTRGAELITMQVYPGAQHGFDDVGLQSRLFLPHVRNINSPTGYGATVGYSDTARRAAQQDVLAFFRGAPAAPSAQALPLR